MIAPIAHVRKLRTKSLYLKFYQTSDLLDSKNFRNIKKVRCIAYNDDGKICLVSNGMRGNWMLPGGTVEKNENPILALRRELLEEADIEIRNYKLIGFLEMKSVNNVTKYIWNRTEMWFVAKVDKVLEQTEDPAFGYVLQRDFFPPNDALVKYLKYGEISKFLEEYMVKYIAAQKA